MTAVRSKGNRHRHLRHDEVIDNKEEIRLIWFGVNIDDSTESLRTQFMLLELNPAAVFYTDLNQCIDLIRSIKDERMFLILSEPLEPTIFLQIGTLGQVVAIFILGTEKENLIKLMNEDERIVNVFSDEDHLLESIRTKMRFVEKQTVTFGLFDEKQKSMRNLSKESASFLWYQVLTHILKQIPHDENSKEEMLETFKDYYRTSQSTLKKIEEFRLTYTSEKAIEWYTEESFLYKQLNRALRTEDIQLLYSFRFFINDMCAAIERKSLKIKDNDTLLLYRGQQLSAEEFDQIKKNVGKIVSTNGFFSTSRDQNVALIFAGQCHKSSVMRSVLFEIEVNPSLVAVEFADIADMSRFKDEQEVLFSINALFRIVSVQFESALNLWKVHMITTDEGPDKMGEYRRSIDSQLKEYSSIIYFGRLIGNEMGQLDVARQYFNTLLRSLPSNHPDIASVYHYMGHLDYDKNNFHSALKNYELAYKIRQTQLPSDSPHISSSFRNLGHTCRAKHGFDRALEYYKAAASIDNRNYSGAHIQKGKVNESIALVLSNKKDFDTALSYLFSAIDMYKCILPAQHPDVAECLGHIGLVYENKGALSVALDYYHQQLEIEEACLPPDHPRLCQHANWIVDAYKKIDDIDTALKFCHKRLNAQKDALTENHPHIARTLVTTASVLQDSNRKKAFEHYQEALSILQCTTIPDYQAISECLIAMGCLYSRCGMLDAALEAHMEAVNIYRQILPSDHVDLAHSLRNLGASYRDIDNISEAKQCFNDSLSIYQANYGPEDEYVKRGLTELANLSEKSSQK